MQNPQMLARLGLFDTTASTAIFILCMLVSAGILLFYAKRHPHPKFRPKPGEILLVGMIFFGVSIVLTTMTRGLFDQELLDEAGKKAKTKKQMGTAPKRGGGNKDDGPGTQTPDGGSGEDIFEEEPPPFVPEEE